METNTKLTPTERFYRNFSSYKKETVVCQSCGQQKKNQKANSQFNFIRFAKGNRDMIYVKVSSIKNPLYINKVFFEEFKP